MRKLFKMMFSDNDGVSHKRVLGAIGFVCLIVYMFTARDITNINTTIEAVSYITIAYGIGTVAEKFVKKDPFSKKRKYHYNDNDDYNEDDDQDDNDYSRYYGKN